MPHLASAQATTTATGSAELSGTIRSALLSDPRTHNLTQAQLDQLVASLTKQAQSKGITVEQMLWRPKPNQVFVPPQATDTVVDPYACGAFPRVLCAWSAAFGFTDPTAAIPVALGVITLIVILALIILIEHHRHQKHIADITGQGGVPPMQ
jgi:hypothetical protein